MNTTQVGKQVNTDMFALYRESLIVFIFQKKKKNQQKNLVMEIIPGTVSDWRN